MIIEIYQTDYSVNVVENESITVTLTESVDRVVEVSGPQGIQGPKGDMGESWDSESKAEITRVGGEITRIEYTRDEGIETVDIYRTGDLITNIISEYDGIIKNKQFSRDGEGYITGWELV